MDEREKAEANMECWNCVFRYEIDIPQLNKKGKLDVLPIKACLCKNPDSSHARHLVSLKHVCEDWTWGLS